MLVFDYYLFKQDLVKKGVNIDKEIDLQAKNLHGIEVDKNHFKALIYGDLEYICCGLPVLKEWTKEIREEYE